MNDDPGKNTKSITRTVRIVNAFGLHARPAGMFVQKANTFPNCKIMVGNGRETVNGRSIMGIITLAAGHGTDLQIEATGEQAEEALAALIELIESKFGEE